eukprot:3937827-Rhodomonas_salina.2
MSLLPIRLSVLAGQPSQPDAAVAFWYLPTEQNEHAPEPFTLLYVPSPHAVHATPSHPSNPTSQMQSSTSSLPSSESVLAGHLAHTDPPVSFRYVPASHPVHAPDPLAPLYTPTPHALLVHAAPSAPS